MNICELKNTGWRFIKDGGQFKNIWVNDKIAVFIDMGLTQHKWILFDNGNKEWTLLNYCNGTKYGVRTMNHLNSLVFPQKTKLSN